jgi:hypothetical protein
MPLPAVLTRPGPGTARRCVPSSGRSDRTRRISGRIECFALRRGRPLTQSRGAAARRRAGEAAGGGLAQPAVFGIVHHDHRRAPRLDLAGRQVLPVARRDRLRGRREGVAAQRDLADVAVLGQLRAARPAPAPATGARRSRDRFEYQIRLRATELAASRLQPGSRPDVDRR